MKREKKANPNDYPLLAYRVSQDEKDELAHEIEAIANLYNRGRKDDERKFLKNDIFVEALRKGLAMMRRQRG